ncbi:Na+/H+ antiporter subunit E [Actinotalea ferrariae]|uniref:Na+/H+ antiporter subunit E n=1 Tax=Actinotalea ferrariae TaxID=1386098 RepID=UPI001C8C2A2C|nr:Na+/H+ antiporter subunit E [Actinotalea ferrariae]MBX9246528.1 Na+/H+ antiporter subunit E [Actinotalea ferrariae]
MSLHPRRRSLGFPLLAVVWLTSVWVLLWGDLSVANVLAGLAIAVLAVRSLRMPKVDFHGRIHVLSLLFLMYRFAVDLVVASTQVALLALNPRRRAQSAVLAVQLRSHSDLYLTLTAQLCSLVPNSVVVEAHRISGMLYVHVLDVGLAGGVDAARQHVLDTEARILRALASDEELEQVGLPRRPLPAMVQSAASGGRR